MADKKDDNSQLDKYKKSNAIQQQVVDAYVNKKTFKAPVSFSFIDGRGEEHRGFGTLDYNLPIKAQNYDQKLPFYSGNITGHFFLKDKDGNYVKDEKGHYVFDSSEEYRFYHVDRAPLIKAQRELDIDKYGNVAPFVSGVDTFKMQGSVNPHYYYTDKKGNLVRGSFKNNPNAYVPQGSNDVVVYNSSSSLSYRATDFIPVRDISKRKDLTEEEMEIRADNNAKYHKNYFNQDQDNVRSRNIKGQDVKAIYDGRLTKKQKKALREEQQEERDAKIADIYSRQNRGRKIAFADEADSISDLSYSYAKQMYADPGYKQFQRNCVSWRKQYHDQQRVNRRLFKDKSAK